MRLPMSSVSLPSPTASTLPFWGFSFAVSGSTIPEAVVASSSTALTITRSPSGLSFIERRLQWAREKGALALAIQECQASTTIPRPDARALPCFAAATLRRLLVFQGDLPAIGNPDSADYPTESTRVADFTDAARVLRPLVVGSGPCCPTAACRSNLRAPLHHPLPSVRRAAAHWSYRSCRPPGAPYCPGSGWQRRRAAHRRRR